MNTKGLIAVQYAFIGAFVSMIAATPFLTDGHRTKKAELVCQGSSLGYTAEYDKDGKKTASLVDVINADDKGYLKNVPQDVIDTCHTLVAGMNEEEKLALIKD